MCSSVYFLTDFVTIRQIPNAAAFAFARRFYFWGDDMRLRTAVLATLLGLAVMDLATAPASAGRLPSINELRSYSIRRLQDCKLLNEIRVSYSARDIKFEHWPKAKAIIPWYSANCMNG
jgi:hypothetical protein